MQARSFLALSTEEARELVTSLGGKPFHARIARREVLSRGVLDYAEMTGLPGALREALQAQLPILAGREEARVEARDRTTKLLVAFEPAEGRAVTVETVHMPSRKADQGATLCVSTQVGCPVGCPFCASGKAGL